MGEWGSSRSPLLVASAILGKAASLGSKKLKHHRSWVTEGNRTAQNSSFAVRREKVPLKVPVSGASMKPCPGNSHKVPDTGKTFVSLPTGHGGNPNRDATTWKSCLPQSSIFSQEKNNTFSSAFDHIWVSIYVMWCLQEKERKRSDCDTGILKEGIYKKACRAFL